jgi:hypothetical protein
MTTTTFDTLLNPIDKINAQRRDERRFRNLVGYVRERSPNVDTMSDSELRASIEMLTSQLPWMGDYFYRNNVWGTKTLGIWAAVGAGAAHGWLGSSWPLYAMGAAATLGALVIDDPVLRSVATGSASSLSAVALYQTAYSLGSQARRGA